ncbi:MAG: mechanosensitive ion channel family protein [Bacillales bacterium]|nr:mechanosensitive ion channel family protein [Bacillales bacterium]
MEEIIEICKYLSKLTHINKAYFLIVIELLVTYFIIKVIRFIIVKVYTKFVEDARKRYLYNQKVNLISNLIFAVIIFLILNPYMKNVITIISFVSAALTLALREMITNWFAGLYIKIKKPFKVEDRIEIDSKKGDVINISDLSFEMLEVGERVYGEQSTGIIVHLPNSIVFSKPIKNYNKAFKYIWNEILVEVPLDADIEKTKDVLYKIINKNEIVKRIPKKMSDQVDDVSLEYRIYYNKLKPIIYTKVVDSHVELYIRYLVHPKKNRNVENEVWLDILEAYKNKEIELYKKE